MSDLRESTYFILAGLLDGPRHGYAIVKSADEMSGGRVRLTAGTLYGALGRLVDQGLVVVQRDEVVSGRRRRYYELTIDGRATLAAEASRLEARAAVVHERLGARGRRSLGATS